MLTVPPLKELEVLPESMDLDILYEDEDVISDQQTKRYGCASLSRKVFRNAGQRASGTLQRSSVRD